MATERTKCPECGSVNVYYRKTLDSWFCRRCDTDFDTLKSMSPGLLEGKGCLIAGIVLVAFIVISGLYARFQSSDSDLCAGRAGDPNCAQYHKGREDSYRPYGR